MQLRSNLATESLLIDHFDINYKVLGAHRYGSVPVRKGFPTACSSLRKTQIFAGTQLDPAGSTLGGSTNSGLRTSRSSILSGCSRPSFNSSRERAFCKRANVSPACTGRRMVRPVLAMPRVIAWRIHHVA